MRASRRFLMNAISGRGALNKFLTFIKSTYPDNAFIWDMQDDNTTASAWPDTDLNGTHVGVETEVPTNGGVQLLSEDNDGVMDADNYFAQNSAILDNLSGTDVLTVTGNTVVVRPRAEQAILKKGRTFFITGEYQGDGVATPMVYRFTTNHQYDTTDIIVSTEWLPFEKTYSDANKIGFGVFEATGSVKWRNLRVIEVVDPEINMQYAIGYDGATTYTKFGSAGFNSIYTPAKNSKSILIRVDNSDVWTDTVERTIWNLESDANNKERLYKTGTGELVYEYIAGGTTNTVTSPVQTSTDWLMVHTIADKGGNDEIELFINAVSQGTSSTLGTWVGNLDPNKTLIGAESITTKVHHGDVTAVVFLRDYVQTSTEVTTDNEQAGIV